jgi:hypothetical protein
MIAEDKSMNNINNKYRKMWGGSLIAINLVTLIVSVCNVFSVHLPLFAKVLLTAVDLIAVPVMVVSSVKKRQIGK